MGSGPGPTHGQAIGLFKVVKKQIVGDDLVSVTFDSIGKAGIIIQLMSSEDAKYWKIETVYNILGTTP